MARGKNFAFEKMPVLEDALSVMLAKPRLKVMKKARCVPCELYSKITTLAAVFCLLAFSGCQVFTPAESPSSSVAGRESVSQRNIGLLPIDEQEARKAVAAVNLERTRVGLPPLTRRRDLDEVAYRHALDLIKMGRLSHISSDGRHLENRLSRLQWTWAGENLARNKGFEDPTAEAIRGWIASPRHRDNMFRPDFSHTGMSVVRDPETGFLYFAQVFLIPL